MNDGARRIFASKASWHREQRAASPKAKVELVIKLQHREIELNRMRAAAGRPIRPMVAWKVRP